MKFIRLQVYENTLREKQKPKGFRVFFRSSSFVIRCAHTQICHVENSLESPVDSRRDFLHYYRLVMGDEKISIIHCI